MPQRGAIAKSVVTTALGVMIATIGIDVMQPVARFTFGTSTLVEGIGLMSVVIGTFAISELLIQARDVMHARTVDKDHVARLAIKRRDFVPFLAEIREIGVWTYLKSAIIGFFIGVLPGAGGSMASFVSYADAMRRSKRPELYGKGSRERSHVPALNVDDVGFDGYREPGVLRRQVPMWLREPELAAIVVGFTTAHVRHGGEGALYVQLRRAR